MLLGFVHRVVGAGEEGVELFQGELFGMPRPAAEVFAPAVMR